MELKEPKNRFCCKIVPKLTVSELAYSPRFVTEIVDGVQRVDGGDAGVLQANDQVTEVFILGHAVGVLADQDKVGPERPARRQRGKESFLSLHDGRQISSSCLVETTCGYNQVQLCFSPVTSITPHGPVCTNTVPCGSILFL